MFEIDPQAFNVHFTPDIIGVYEPVMAVMFLNVDDDEFDEWSKDPYLPSQMTMTEVFGHEAYHCFQSYTTGYCYSICERLASAVVELTDLSWPRLLGDFGPLYASIIVGATTSVLRPLMSSRARTTLTYAHELRKHTRWVSYLNKLASTNGETSIWGALNPGIHAARESVLKRMHTRGPDRLSVADIIEGSAFLYGRQMAGHEGSFAEDFLDPSFEPTGSYQNLITVSLDAHPTCSVKGILGAAAIALRYEHPEMGYVEVLELFAQAELGHEMDLAREVVASLPTLPDAGAVLGTASEYHSRNKTKYSVYLPQFERLATEWTIDELDILMGQDGIEHIPTGQLGFSLTTRQGPRGDGDKAAGAVAISALYLPQGPSIARLRRELQTGLPD
jgi:hypothetical protein